MDFDQLQYLRRQHPAWRLLAADHAPLIVGFLHHTFIAPNIRAVGEAGLVAALDDYLFAIHNAAGETVFPKASRDYLADWTADERAWLRRYYPPDSDEAHFDLMPAAENAIQWVVSLESRAHFVGAESRLRTIFELLRELVHGAETDPQRRIAELTRQRDAIDAEIERVRAGDIELMDATRQRERFLEATGTARALLSDFRQVEQNFRDLDRNVRERIATWAGSRGQLLGDILGEHDAIADSDQGKSFRAFWDFIMSPASQEELTELLSAAMDLAPIAELAPDTATRRIHYDWLAAGETTQRTVAQLSAQLRRYLDDQARLENRRIMDLIGHIEHHAIAVRDDPPAGVFTALDATAPTLDLPMERPLFSPPIKPDIRDQVLVDGDENIDASALFEQTFVDRERLRGHIRAVVAANDQATLARVIEAHPLTQGMAELVTYLALADEPAGGLTATIDESTRDTVDWFDSERGPRRAQMPRVIFSRV
ncbi:DUF3375 domain-containing protein [Salinisphaera sp.]|uniref:DUF3375 domain-containing protein n=1 Tax=Salinisphaera sp. TaxID=1914330 RepID=UPI000C39DC7C|nr:DUF3375 domain-containing protein [Salinisphaera sp.]MAS10383.1 hypothetical protein [Salinisphaera sp.]